MSEQTAAPHVVSTLQEGLAAVMWRTPQAISRLPHWAQVLICALTGGIVWNLINLSLALWLWRNGRGRAMMAKAV